jgi:hypothetical protein
MLILSGLMGYLINIAIFMQIRYTSALTNAVSGTAKGCVQTAVGWLLFGNEISFTVHITNSLLTHSLTPIPLFVSFLLTLSQTFDLFVGS